MSENDLKASLNFRAIRLLLKLSKRISVILCVIPELFQKILGVSNKLNFNELEISYWAIIIERTIHSSTDIALEPFLQNTAYAVKFHTTRETYEFAQVLELDSPGFCVRFHKWAKINVEFLKSTPQEIQIKFQELSVEKTEESQELYLNYDQAVDSLISNFNGGHENATEYA